MTIDFNGKPGEYTYSEGANGKSAEGIVAVGAQSARNPGAQRAAGGDDRQPGDHGGHLIAHSMGGKNAPCNLDAQAANVNQIDQRGVERNLTELARDPNNTVYIGVQNFTSNGSQRPDATMITGAVRDNTTGNIDIQHTSFQNASHQDQESWNNIADQNSEVDSRQDNGMSAEERALANELSGAEDAVDMSLGNATVTSFDASVFDSDDPTAQDDTSMDDGNTDSDDDGNSGNDNSDDDGLGM